MSRYRIRNWRAQDELSQYIHHLNVGPNGEYYRCWICRSHPEFESITGAMEHEYDPERIAELRDLDGPTVLAPMNPTRSATQLPNNPAFIPVTSPLPLQA